MAEFNSYADVQAALDAEYNLWVSGLNPQGRTEEGQAARDWWLSQNTSTPSGGGAPIIIAAIPPNPWNTNITYIAPTGVKQADPDIITFDDEIVSGTFLVERFFEEIGAIELINISRSDIINGDLVNYTPIKNLSALRRQYNPNNIIAIASTAQSAFSRFRIDLLLRGINEPYLDDEGNLVIEVDIVDEDEFIEAEIATSGTMNRIEL